MPDRVIWIKVPCMEHEANRAGRRHCSECDEDGMISKTTTVKEEDR